MSELTDDRLDTKALAERALSNAAVASQHHIIDQGHEQADEVLCEALILNIEQAINLALRAAASTRTEGAGVKFDGIAKRKLDDLMARGWAIDGYAITKDGKHGFVTTGAFVGWWLPDQGMPSGLTPPASKVTTDEAEERG